MKSNTLKLPGVVLPDAEAKTLRSMLDTLRAAGKEHIELKEQLVTDSKKLDRYLRETDPSDDLGMRSLVGLKTRVEILPHAIERRLEKAELQVPGILSACDEFSQRLRANLKETVERRKKVLAELIEPAFPGEIEFLGNGSAARSIHALRESPPCVNLLILADRVSSGRCIMAAQNANWLTELPIEVESLLALAEEAAAL